KPSHALPVELILFFWESSSSLMVVALLYHSIEFTRSAQLSKFLFSHDIPNDPMESRFGLIQSLYIGRTPHTYGDLGYGSFWPLTVICRILWLSTSLKHLTILDLDQNSWRTLDYAIPSSLQYLSLDLERKPQLRQFTSTLTYMRDDEVRDVVCYPSMRTFRRIVHSESSNVGPRHAISQVGCISRSKTLEKLEIVICRNPGGTEVMTQPEFVALDQEVKEITDDPRVMIREDAHREFLSILHDEYEGFRVASIHQDIKEIMDDPRVVIREDSRVPGYLAP
ncbi:hypothetical protein BDZ97DRAFT_1806816, partial [Flammula alnicola]